MLCPWKNFVMFLVWKDARINMDNRDLDKNISQTHVYFLGQIKEEAGCNSVVVWVAC